MLTPPNDILLEQAGIIDPKLATSLQGMVGFRNVAIHPYEQMDLSVLRWVVDSGHQDWIRLGQALGVSIRT